MGFSPGDPTGKGERRSGERGKKGMPGKRRRMGIGWIETKQEKNLKRQPEIRGIRASKRQEMKGKKSAEPRNCETGQSAGG